METTQLYILTAGEYYKIGITKSIKNRVKQIQTGCPLEIRDVYFVEFDNKFQALEAEKKLHSFFVSASTSGEWFLSKQGWLKNAEDAIRVIKNDLLVYLKIYKTSPNNRHIYSDALSRIMQDNTLVTRNKLELVNIYKSDLLKAGGQQDIILRIEKTQSKLLRQLAISEKDINKDDFKRIMGARRRNDENTNVIKIKSISTFGKNKLTKANIKDVKNIEQEIKKCNIGADLPILEEIKNTYPHLSKMCESQVLRINKKINKVSKNNPCIGKIINNKENV